MFNYAYFTVEEFLKDDWFREWVLAPTHQTDAFWNEWVRLHPEQQATIDQARALLRTLEMPHQPVSNAERDEVIRETWAKIRQKQEPSVRTIPLWNWSRMAAAVFVLAGLGWAAILYQNRTQFSVLPGLVSTQAHDQITVTNPTLQPLVVPLPDGSRVTLSPAASLHYDKRFTETERRTFLKGEAFFEVARNPARPFLVITEKLVTRVLGTSFWVKAEAGMPESRVIVKTGKVSVFRTRDLEQKQAKPEGVVLTPNQQVALTEADNRFAKSLIAQPVPIKTAGQPSEISYAETPAPQIFQALSQTYGIDILYDDELLKHCQITATLADESLFEKLDLLCRSIHATYEVIDTQIVIYSKGCK
ncbi:MULTISPECIES: FecR family protein [Larkinella]|uniref:FecR family protein n=1 Tax=Larkinella punicea TaxID=2315727 RepID=A0A368JM39_9BACT|nr:FecR family protein [Larkinella punicea]RCR68582.1 FecR family protein [Larkinella punicea]